MKLFVINERAFEYNDEYYRSTGGGNPVKAFKDRKNAAAACFELNEAARKERKYKDESEGGPDANDYFYVAEVEVADDDVQSYRSAREAVKKAREDATKLCRTAFESEADKLFGEHAELKSFGWTQYTPYFNDGDTCIFSVHSDEPDINDQSGYDLDSGKEYKDGKCVQVREPSVEYKLQKPVREFLQQFDEEDMLAMFGDHVRVTVKRKRGGGVKATAEEYSHD